MSRLQNLFMIPSPMFRREMRKLAVEMQRCKHYRRPHLPLDVVLEEARWTLKAKARRNRKGWKLPPKRSY